MKPVIIRPTIFLPFPEIVAAQSTRSGGVSESSYGMNLSSHVGDSAENVAENRRRFYAFAGVQPEARIVYQNQVHSSNVQVVTGSEGIVLHCDALISRRSDVFLAVSIADCTPILLYAPDVRIVAAAHAGWRGTEQMIALKAVRKLLELGADAKSVRAFIGASASREKYEVGLEVATLFDKRHVEEIERPGDRQRKFLLDVKAANREQLTFAGIPDSQIEVSPLCTISDVNLHSFRRDGKRSGRMLAIIGRKAAV